MNKGPIKQMTSFEYFDEIFSGLETKSIPLPDKKSNKNTFSDFKYNLSIDKESIKGNCEKLNISEITLFNAVFSLVTARFSGYNDSLYVLEDEKSVPIYCKFDENTTVSNYLKDLLLHKLFSHVVWFDRISLFS